MWSASSFSGHLGDSKSSQDLLFRLTGASFATRWHLVVRARNSLFHEASMRASAQRTGQRETEIALLESMLRNQVTRLLMPYEQCQTRLIISTRGAARGAAKRCRSLQHSSASLGKNKNTNKL